MKVIAYSLPLMSLLGMFSIVATDDLYCTGSFDESGRPPPNTRCNGDCIKDSGRWGSSYCYTANGNWGAECVPCNGIGIEIVMAGCNDNGNGPRCKFPFIGEDGREYENCTDTKPPKNAVVSYGGPWCRTDCQNPPCPAMQCLSDCPSCQNCVTSCSHTYHDSKGNPCSHWWEGYDCQYRNVPFESRRCPTAAGDVITCHIDPFPFKDSGNGWDKEQCGKCVNKDCVKPCEGNPPSCKCKCRELADKPKALLDLCMASFKAKKMCKD